MTRRTRNEGHRPALGQRLESAARGAIRLWALGGGLLLVAVVLVTVYSTVMNLLFRAPLPGDFEIVEIGVALAAFAFLPYGQLTGANVTVDVFTMRAGPRLRAAMALAASLAAAAFAALLLWRMSAGLADYLHYREVTPIMGFPRWLAFPPILLSLLLLLVAALLTARDGIALLRGGAAASASGR